MNILLEILKLQFSGTVFDKIITFIVYIIIIIAAHLYLRFIVAYISVVWTQINLETTRKFYETEINKSTKTIEGREKSSTEEQDKQ